MEKRSLKETGLGLNRGCGEKELKKKKTAKGAMRGKPRKA